MKQKHSFVVDCENLRMGCPYCDDWEELRRMPYPWSESICEALLEDHLRKVKRKMKEPKEPKITRVEVIDSNGRSYSNWDEENEVECSVQDEGRTLKVFITNKRQEAERNSKHEEEIRKLEEKNWKIKVTDPEEDFSNEKVSEKLLELENLTTHLMEQQASVKCWCHTCIQKETGFPVMFHMVLCPDCGNKRCPKATNHELACTNSNEPGQEGSIYQ